MSEPTSSPRRALHLQGVRKRFGTVNAVNGIDLEVLEGEILGVVGPSGSGKTTLLRCIDLLDIPEEGTIEYWGKERVVAHSDSGCVLESGEVFHEFSEELAGIVRRQIGFVFQGLNLWSTKTVKENLLLAPAVVCGEARASSELRARELCQRYGIEDKLEARVWQLSGGQQQRVAIVRALMLRPKLMLLDEITSALDPLLTVDVLEAIRELRAQGITTLLITHHIQFALSLCDRVAFLHQGRVAQVGPPAELIGSPRTDEVADFLSKLREIG